MFEFYPEVALSREKLLEKIKTQVSEKRFKHILGVEKAAIKLAKKYKVDQHKASLAALLHDYAKEQPDQVFLDLIDKHNLDSGLKDWGNNIWHGSVGIYKIQEDLGLKDPEILHAIEVHTVGSSDMSELAKVLYVADYIEEGRDFPGVVEARAMADYTLDRAVAYEAMRLIAYLTELRVKIYPQSIETYNAFVHYLKN